MGYNNVFKDIIQPIKTSYHCVGNSKVPMHIEQIWDGTPLEGIDHAIDSIGVRDNTSEMYRHRPKVILESSEGKISLQT